VTKLGRIDRHVRIDYLAHGVLVDTNTLDDAPLTGALLVLIEVTPKPRVDVVNIAFFTE
jgi:hypothetical protein